MIDAQEKTESLTPAQVLEIDGLLKKGDFTHKELAARFNVASKTISRIKNGYFWSEITGRPKKDVKRDIHRCLTADLQQKMTVDLDAAIEHIIDALPKKKAIEDAYLVLEDWGLAVDRPLGWATFTAWYGTESLITDGVLAWCIPCLVRLCQALASVRSDIKELPTFACGRMMSYPIGNQVKVLSIRESAFVLDRGVALSKKIASIAAHHHFDVRWAGEQRGIVYLTKAKSRKTHETNSAALGCAATMELPMKDAVEDLGIEVEEFKDPEIKDVLVKSRNRAPWDEAKVATILTCFDAAKANASAAQTLLHALLSTMAKRSYKLRETPAATVQTLNALNLDLRESFVECLGIIDNDDLDELLLSVCSAAADCGCYPFKKEPHFLLLDINTQKPS